MNWSNVRLIFQREVRDQLRDRRTLFLIFVLPVLLYPLLGMSLFQVAQFVREQPTSVLVIGARDLPLAPPLVVGNRFDERWFSDPARVSLLQLEFLPEESAPRSPVDAARVARRVLAEGTHAAVLFFPPDFSQRLQGFQHAIQQAAAGAPVVGGLGEIPSPLVFHHAAKDKSRLANDRLSLVLGRWREEIARQNLASSRLPEAATRPFVFEPQDLSDRTAREAAVWSKLLPSLLLFWALTGAFYPAIDLCAGEKERGTLETLLSSPAHRSEIVWGKLLTIMLFSAATVIFNVASMGLTGAFVLTQLPGFGPPPWTALGATALALPPVAALFGALCLALAAFARSSKEGQYYLMPLVLVTLPLVVLPMSPGVELTLGNSLIPVTGIVLLLRTLIEGDYLRALPYVVPVAGVTLVCVLLSIRWAIEQFNTETVLFREGERFGLGIWLRHLLRDREDIPSAAEAVCCGMLILLIQFFMRFALPRPESFLEFARLALVTQLVVIATPALLMAVMLTRRPAQTLALRLPPLAAVPAAMLLAAALHPLASLLRLVVTRLYPVSPDMARELSQLAGLLGRDANPWLVLAVIAVVPAVCEELAFRGFILSGARRLGYKWRAIVLASLFFAVAHPILQQTVITFLIGLVLGYLAVQTGSLLPPIAFHAVHNALALLPAWIEPEHRQRYPLVDWLYARHDSETYLYNGAVVAAGAFLALVILYWLHRLPYRRTPEESRRELVRRQALESCTG